MEKKLIEKTENADTKQTRPWLYKKGQSGNPAGKPKGTVSITTAIKRELEKISPEQKKTWLQLTVKRILDKAVSEGDVQMIKTLWNYVDGMPKQDIDVTGGLNILFDSEFKDK